MESLSKNQLRKDIKHRLKAQSHEARAEKSRLIQDKLLALEVFQRALTVVLYAACDGEVETREILGSSLKSGKIIGLPKVDQKHKQIIPIRVDDLQKDLENGSYGILEPRYAADKILRPQDIDLVIVPALAFDRFGYRLGRGQGYYDRFLSTLLPRTITIGLAFDFQRIESLPEKNSFDLPVSLVITD